MHFATGLAAACPLSAQKTPKPATQQEESFRTRTRNSTSTIYVSLGPSDVVNAILAKPEVHLHLNDGETHFTRAGFAHVARNLADTWQANYRSHFTLVMCCGWKRGKSRRWSRQERTSQLGFY